MKPNLNRFAVLLLAGALLAGCAAQRKTPEKALGQTAAAATFHRAAEALAARHFVIELDQVFMPSGKWANITDCFISMQGSQAEVVFSPDLLRYEPGQYGSSMQLKDDEATLEKTGRKKNKYTEYTLFVKDHQRFLRRSYRMRIQLFANTDRCDIRAFYTIQGVPAFTLRGRVIPRQPIPIPGDSE